MKSDNRLLKKIAYPPFYYFSSIFTGIILFLFFPEYNVKYIPLALMGIVVGVLGLYILLRSSDIFKRVETTYINETPSAFVTEGLFTYSRNPMYLGALINIIGIVLFIGNIIGFFIPILFFSSINFICIPVEEKIMENTFGKVYLKYKKQVRRWF